MIGPRCATTGKLQYGTVNEASAIMRAMLKQNARRDSRRSPNGGHLTAFRCRFCNAWHVGHVKPKHKKRDKIRFDSIDE